MPTGIHGIRTDEIRTIRPERIQEIAERRNPQQHNGSSGEEKRDRRGRPPEEGRSPPEGEKEGRVDILV